LQRQANKNLTGQRQIPMQCNQKGRCPLTSHIGINTNAVRNKKKH